MVRISLLPPVATVSTMALLHVIVVSMEPKLKGPEGYCGVAAASSGA